MSTITAFIKSHPVLTYFVLTFAISWGGVLLAMGGPAGIRTTPEQYQALLPSAILAMLAGPSVAGILMTGFVHGRAGLRELLSHLTRWRVSARYYAVALLIAPLLMMALLLMLSLFSPEFLPSILTTGDRAALLIFGIVVGLVAGIFEELGWTGFAVPELRLRYGVLATGLIVGILWATWHLLVAFWASSTVTGPLSPASYLVDPFLYLAFFRVLMVWVYDRTGSLLVVMLMHASLTASPRILFPAAVSGVPLIAFDIVWAAVVGVIVMVLALGGRLSRQPLPGP